MTLKGHSDILKDASGYSKALIFSKNEEEDFVHKEYTFKDGKVIQITDYINWIISKYEYNHENDFVVRFYRFDEDPNKATLDSSKNITSVNGLEVKETLYEIEEGELQKVYTGEKSYEEGLLVKEVYKYTDFDYVIEHSWKSKKSIKTTKYPEGDGEIQYLFDSEGFLKEYLFFKHEGYCQKIEYKYLDGKLHKMIEFPHLPFKKSIFKKDIKLQGQPDFIHETTFHYNKDTQLLEKEVKIDTLNDTKIETTYYKYED